MQQDQIVSFDDEKLILVDPDDRVLGYENKDACHQGSGVLHRAFSIFIFTSFHELLLQRRSPQKRLWGEYWSNTCCSHPRKGETMEQATARRLKEELGLESELLFLYKFQYQAQFDETGAENELCSVYVGKSDQLPSINPTEISGWGYINYPFLDKELAERPARYTPWFRMEWKKLREEFWTDITNLRVREM